MTTTVSDLMRKSLVTIEESSSVQESARKMKDKNVSSLIIVDENRKPKGLITERDFILEGSVFMMYPQVR